MGNSVIYARTEEGAELPVIDVTNAAFAVSVTDGELTDMAEQYIRESEQRQEIPEALWDALRRSILGQAIMAASGTFLDGMSTYVLKLGPENLGADASPFDRRIAGSFPALTTRIRMQDMAQLLAEGLAAAADAQRRQPVCLVNIGGGVGAESWNALIYLQAGLQTGRSDLLTGRKIGIAVMDLDPCGPAFGVRAVEALHGPAAPLSGLDIAFQYLSYEWSETERLEAALEELGAKEAVCGVSSEGGLFEYGSDDEIVANLKALHGGTAANAIVVGSVTRDGGPVRASQGANRVATRPRTMNGFQSLAEQGEWRVQEVVERPFSFNVRLVKA